MGVVDTMTTTRIILKRRLMKTPGSLLLIDMGGPNLDLF
ncbi:hypothetical protein Taro_005244 [Colocasia esculenta]|uniref:Uncharacterized protein n=1 Tax=Colocasia esculenta TaxID=4460 RepID=A0A843TMK1_COLES|nr:hypothetical protein [Colocasia esculenta]